MYEMLKDRSVDNRMWTQMDDHLVARVCHKKFAHDRLISKLSCDFFALLTRLKCHDGHKEHILGFFLQIFGPL